MVRGDHESTRVGDVPAYLGQPPVGRVEDRRDPLARGVERGAPGLGGEVLGQRLSQRGLHLVTRPGPPAHRAGVRQEHHRANHAVWRLQSAAIPIEANTITQYRTAYELQKYAASHPTGSLPHNWRIAKGLSPVPSFL